MQELAALYRGETKRSAVALAAQLRNVQDDGGESVADQIKSLQTGLAKVSAAIDERNRQNDRKSEHVMRLQTKATVHDAKISALEAEIGKR